MPANFHELTANDIGCACPDTAGGGEAGKSHSNGFVSDGNSQPDFCDEQLGFANGAGGRWEAANFPATESSLFEPGAHKMATRLRLSTMRLSAPCTGLKALAIESSPLSTGADWLKVTRAPPSMNVRWLSMTMSGLSTGSRRLAIGKWLLSMTVQGLAMRVCALSMGWSALSNDPSELSMDSPPLSITAFSTTYDDLSSPARESARNVGEICNLALATLRFGLLRRLP